MLQNSRVLVVEEEFLIAADIQRILEENGVREVIVRSRPGQATQLAGGLAGIDLAILEGRLGAPDVVNLAALLHTSRTPVVVVSADAAIGALFPGAVLLEKPFGEDELVAACEAAARSLLGPPKPPIS